MNIIKGLSDRGSSSYILRVIFSLSVLLAVLISIFSCIIAVFFSHRTDSIITDMNMRALEQLADFTDKYVFENVDYLCETYFDEGSEYESAKKFFYDMEEMSRGEMESLRDNLSNIRKQNNFLDDIYLYNSRFDSFVSAGSGIVFGASDARNHLAIENRFFSYLDSISDDFYVPQDDNIMLRNQDGLIIYVHYVSSSETSAFVRRDVSCVIMIINVRNIAEFMHQTETAGLESFAIINSEQTPLIHSENFPGIERLISDDGVDFSEIMSKKRGSLVKTFLGKRANYIWVHSGRHDWNYVYILSLTGTYRNILMVIMAVLLVGLLIISIGTVVINFYGRRLYRPFNTAIQKAIDNLDADEYSDNELETLNHLIDKFERHKAEYNKMSEQYSDISMHIMALDIVRGIDRGGREANLERLAARGIDFTKKEYGLILIEFNPAMISTFTVEQSDIILFDVIDALRETFNCVVTLDAEYTIALVMNYDRVDYPKITSELKKLIPEKSLINLYCCEPVTELKTVSERHARAMNMLKYSYLCGFDNVFDVSALEKRDRDNAQPDGKAIVLLENLIRDGQKERFCDECNRILTHVKTGRHSYAYAQETVLKVLSALCRVAREYDISTENEDILKQITNNKNYDNATMYLFEFADKLFERISTKDYERKFDLINSIKTFIDEHITEDVSLSSVAEQFNLSVGYLSKFFKENMGQSFSKYVIEKKFSCAAKMLKEHPERPVSDIANDFGYFDTAYFSRQFKAHYGVTPIQYRKLGM